MKYLLPLLLLVLPAFGQTNTNTVITLSIADPTDTVSTNWTGTGTDPVILMWREGWKELGDTRIRRGDFLVRGDRITLIDGREFTVGQVKREGGHSYAVLTNGRRYAYIGWSQIASAVRQ